MKLVEKEGPQSKRLVLKKESREEDKKSVWENGRQRDSLQDATERKHPLTGLKGPKWVSTKPEFGAQVTEEMISLHSMESGLERGFERRMLTVKQW